MNYQWNIKNKKFIKNAIDNSVEKLTHNYLLMELSMELFH